MSGPDRELINYYCWERK